MIISVHTPKCGGTSFRSLLENHYASKLIPDYQDKPLNKTEQNRIGDVENFKSNFDNKSYDALKDCCIHGHFLPYKYVSLAGKEGVNFMTWLRDPIERMASHYFFWKRTEKIGDFESFGNLRKKVCLENWSLEQFCFCKELQNVYTIFFYKFPIEWFAFIGITEFFDTDLKYFASKFLGRKEIAIPYKNVNKSESESYINDSKLIEDLKSFHSEDYALYEYALKRRTERLNF